MCLGWVAVGPLQPHIPLPSGIPVSGEEEEEEEGVEVPLSAALVFMEVWPGGLLNMALQQHPPRSFLAARLKDTGPSHCKIFTGSAQPLPLVAAPMAPRGARGHLGDALGLGQGVQEGAWRGEKPEMRQSTAGIHRQNKLPV